MHRSLFDYELPPEAIAQEPVTPRDSSRLLDTRTMTNRTFADLPDLLDEGDVVVVNTTRVRAARLLGRKITGGSVEVLLLDHTDDVWTALVRPARRIRSGQQLFFGAEIANVTSNPQDGVISLVFDHDGENVAQTQGQVPLPPYIHAGLDDPDRYQTVYATNVGSAAAPTAGLHMTEDIMARLLAKGVVVASTELRVGLDTFRPIAADEIEDHRMHTEWRAVPAETVEVIDAAKHRGNRVVAIGTTVVRTLESAVVDGQLTAVAGPTDIYIRPGHEFCVVDGLVTNFHVPGSTLLVMISALLPEWRDAYRHALSHEYRFLSFGDAMYIERA